MILVNFDLLIFKQPVVVILKQTNQRLLHELLYNECLFIQAKEYVSEYMHLCVCVCVVSVYKAQPLIGGYICTCVCVCVCVYKRTTNKWRVCVCVCVRVWLHVHICVYVVHHLSMTSFNESIDVKRGLIASVCCATIHLGNYHVTQPLCFIISLRGQQAKQRRRTRPTS